MMFSGLPGGVAGQAKNKSVLVQLPICQTIPWKRMSDEGGARKRNDDPLVTRMGTETGTGIENDVDPAAIVGRTVVRQAKTKVNAREGQGNMRASDPRRIVRRCDPHPLLLAKQEISGVRAALVRMNRRPNGSKIYLYLAMHGRMQRQVNGNMDQTMERTMTMKLGRSPWSRLIHHPISGTTNVRTAGHYCAEKGPLWRRSSRKAGRKHGFRVVVRLGLRLIRLPRTSLLGM